MPHGVAGWKSEQTLVQGILATVTLGIYSPRSVFIECSRPTAVGLSGESEEEREAGLGLAPLSARGER